MKIGFLITFYFLTIKSVCAGRSDGFYALSSSVHDCRNYIRCASGVSTTLSCPTTTVSGVVRQQYFNPLTGTCGLSPQNAAFCSPGKRQCL